MFQRPSRLPILIVTGASGFIGRYFLEEVKEKFYIYALARRSQKAAHVPRHPNIEWIRLDIAHQESVNACFEEIARKGGADFILHLAGYYDFDNVPHPEFKRTNENGTRHILEAAKNLNIKRFIFSSSLTVTEFTRKNTVINEESPADADFPYAISKRICEEMVKEYSTHFPCAIVRLAAIFSDWCEYGPLYMLLSTWFSQRWDSRILAGKGQAAIPYMHVKNLNKLFLSIMAQSDQLPNCPVLIGSPDGCTSQLELFEISVRYNFGELRKPIFVPRWLAAIGVALRDLRGRFIGHRPFERLWMMKYIDKQMRVDASATRRLLGWQPRSRFLIRRRLLFLIENMKSNPYEWKRRNLEAITKKAAVLPNLIIYEVMLRKEKESILQIVNYLMQPDDASLFPNYRKLDKDKLCKRVKHIYHILKQAVRTGDRFQVLSYAHNLAIERFVEGFDRKEVQNAVAFVGRRIVDTLLEENELKNMKQRIYDEIMMTIQLIEDEIEDSYEELTGEADTL
ncbi:MAG TPA: NAD(P)-dependent oxidoreductase [Caldithrix abyssi]|uniref:NAD(P)-dependent oxidoreductase n=1 Tax=Caldithrix abyssi TaxID=187145 RepID=A0A7V4TYZ4_CALAY|nr:NAD(P)-dependent oxidoreductase [Caldithrix abyssi]